MKFGRSILDRWHLDPEIAFLNHGSFGACPKVVLATQSAFRQQMETTPVRFLDPRHRPLQAPLDRMASFLECDAEGLAFVDNATTAVNAVVRSHRFEPGDAIVTLSHAYGAVANTLRWVCRERQLRLIEVPVPFPIADAELVLSALRPALAQSGVKLAVLDHITSATGLVMPIEEMVGLCGEAGVPVLVDGAHVPGHMPLSLDRIGADWYVGNLHKWLFAPKGSAVLYTRADHRATTHPTVISWGLDAGYRTEFDWQGTRDITNWLSCPSAVDFFEQLGPTAVWSHNHGLADAMGTMLADAWGTPRPAPRSMCRSLVTLQPPIDLPPTREAADALNDRLYAEHGVEVPCFPFGDRVWLRISAQVYNAVEDYERLAAAF